MLDARARELTRPLVELAASRAERWGWRPGYVTLVGWLAGVGSCGAILIHQWAISLVLWLVNRALDGLDGALARRTGATLAGGFVDLMADFSIYAGVVTSVALALPAARLASVVLLFTYYVSGVALLGAGAIARRADHTIDERSLGLTGGLAEGTETIVVYVILLAWPSHAAIIEWIFSGAVALTALQRVLGAYRGLRATSAVAEGRRG